MTNTQSLDEILSKAVEELIRDGMRYGTEQERKKIHMYPFSIDEPVTNLSQSILQWVADEVVGKNFRKNKNTNGYRRGTGNGDWEAAPETWAIAVNAEHKLQRQTLKREGWKDSA